MNKEMSKQLQKKSILEYISESYFSNLLLITEQRLNELNKTITNKFKILPNEAEEIIEIWLDNHDIENNYIKYSDNFLKSAKDYNDVLKKNNVKIDYILVDKLVNWCGEVKNSSTDSKAFQQLCKRSFILDYIFHVHEKELRTE